MTSQSPAQQVSEQGQTYTVPYRYEDAPELPLVQPDLRYSPQPQSQSPSQPHTPQLRSPTTKSEVKPRLRKACDSCSVRKVKCDETGPPCKSCAVLDIPCTFNRPSRRRGPPNRHAEAIKRQRLDDGSYNNLFAASPTRDAAYSLAALAAPVLPSAETICDLNTLQVLVDDYFTYIHPLIPFPHEPTFRLQFAQRLDKTDRGFLALLASMIEALVASFPRRPRQLFTSDLAKREYPNAGSLIDRCHQVFSEARGTGYLDCEPTLNMAASSYFAAIAAAYMFDMTRCRLYMGESIMLLRALGFHRAQEIPSPSTHVLYDGSHAELDHIYQQSGRRMFWLCFVGSMSIRQLGDFDGDLLMPPTTQAEGLPPLPLELDDEFITHDTLLKQPADRTSLLTGFNLNVRIFRAFHDLIAVEMAFGANVILDWEKQRRLIQRALATVKEITQVCPSEYRLDLLPEDTDATHYSHLFNGRRDSTADPVGLRHADDPARHLEGLPYPRRAVQFEIQKANIYATQLATRSYLVEKYWTLYDVYDHQHRLASPGGGLGQPPTSSPTNAIVASGLITQSEQAGGRTVSSEAHLDAEEQALAVEREDIVRDMALLLKRIRQANMEPNGLSFCHKIRQVASTLLNQPRERMTAMPTLDSKSVDEYLHGFVDVLSKLERLGSSRIRSSDSEAMGQPMTIDEVEEEELIHWASLRDHQERFVQSEGFFVPTA